jgi:hypothetical protein
MAGKETTKERCCEAEVDRTAAKCVDSARARCGEGGSVFRARSRSPVHERKNSWDLHTAMSMAGLGAISANNSGPRSVRPVFGWFAEGFGTLNLKQARPCPTRRRAKGACAVGNAGGVWETKVAPQAYGSRIEISDEGPTRPIL